MKARKNGINLPRIPFHFCFIFLLFASPFQLQADSPDLRYLNAINSPAQAGDRFWKDVSNSVVYTSFGTPLTLYAAGRLSHDSVLVQDAYISLGALAITGAATWILKTAVKRPRPFDDHSEEIFKKGTGGGYSFPSGHTSSAFSTATSLSFAFPKWYVIAPAYTYASMVGYSRMYLGVHYPSDVLVGAIIGTGSAYLSVRLQEKLLSRKRSGRH